MQKLEKQFHIHCKAGDVGRYCILPGDPGQGSPGFPEIDAHEIIGKAPLQTLKEGAERLSTLAQGFVIPEAGNGFCFRIPSQEKALNPFLQLFYSASVSGGNCKASGAAWEGLVQKISFCIDQEIFILHLPEG